MNAIENFRTAMHAAGLDYAGPILDDGKLHRIRVEGDKRPNSYYVLHSGPPAAGAFGCWKRGIKDTWCDQKSKQLSDTEWQQLRDRLHQVEQERDRADKQRHDRAQETAAWILRRATPVDASHPYLTAKGVAPCDGLHVRWGKIIVPLLNESGQLQSVQFIHADGKKRFLRDGKVVGCRFVIFGSDTLVLCEGLATGISIAAATGFTVLCAFSKGNLPVVATSSRSKWPAREMIIAADNDQFTDGNPGVTKATETAKAVGAKLAVPQFQDVSNTPTDFNDLHQLEGLEAVKAQITKAEAPKETEAEVFDRLSTLPGVEYDRHRTTEARRLGIRVRTLDAEVDARRGKQTNDGSLGLIGGMANAEPWPEEVDGAALLDELRKELLRFIILPPHAADALALYVLNTYVAAECFYYVAIVLVVSPEPECGKGRVLDVAQKLCLNTFRTSNTSAAVLYRLVGGCEGRATLLVDEIDSQSEEQRESIANVLKSGYEKTGTTHRIEKVGDTMKVVEFSTYCPKFCAAINIDNFDHPTVSRAIIIRMKKKTRSEKVEKFRRYDGTDIRRKCLRWAKDHADSLRQMPLVKFPEELCTDRQEDIWEPLIMVAQACSEDWTARAWKACAGLTGGNTSAVENVNHHILRRCCEYVENHPNSDHVRSQELVEHLNGLEDADFKEWRNGKGISQSKLATKLGGYSIYPTAFKSDGKTVRGYNRTSFQDAAERYLRPPSPAQGATPQPGQCLQGDQVVSQGATPETGCTSESAIEPKPALKSCTVAVSKAESTPMGSQEALL